MAATRRAGFTPPSAINHRASSSRAPSCRSTHQRGKPTRPLTSNRLSGINLATGGTRAYAYDAAGNVVSDSRGAGYAYTYDAAGRMATMSINGVLQGSYKYDFAGRQAVRTLTSPVAVTIHSVFDSQGRRIAEYNEGTGALIREYVWMGWEPIAVIEGGVVSFVRTDHIGRPVFATNAAGAKVWTTSYTPFGGVRTTTGTPINARFPGQWFQSESGLHQNWMRDYDPTTGRYLQADPLGLVDGASVYGYAGQSPMENVDPSGEFAWGMAFGAANLAYQLYSNNWRLECVDWFDVGMWTLGGGAVGAFQKGAFTFKAGSNTWGATRKWMTRRGIQPYTATRTQRHHWLFEQNKGWGRNVPDWVKNQPWNTNPVSAQFNNWMNRANSHRHLLGAPAWAPELVGGLATMGYGLLRGEGCGCETVK